MYIKLSSSYSVRNDVQSSFLIKVRGVKDKVRTNFNETYIPQLMGYILTEIGKCEIPESYELISKQLEISPDSVKCFVEQLIENKDKKVFRISEDKSIVFPEYLLEKSDIPCEREFYTAQNFDTKAEFNLARPSMPFSANLMVTTICSTDCIYCYANRQLSPSMSTDKLIDVIHELYRGGVVNLTLTGGDFFAYKDWKKILYEVRKYNYKPYISSKTCLSYSDICFLKEMGYEEFQFSLDSSDPKVLSQLIRVGDNYIEKVSEMLCSCEKVGMRIQIRSVATKINGTKEKIELLYNYLSQYSCINEWDITPVFFSEYKKEKYKDYEIDNISLKNIYDFSRKDDLKFRIVLNKINENGYQLKKCKTVDDFVCKNQICLGNTTSISILANGICTVCEMLYDHIEYQLGNVYEHSIYEIWNSEKALTLYNPKQIEIQGDSVCKTCTVFDKCKTGFGKRVCYSDIAKTGGSKDDPDPRCPKSKGISIIL